jgi:tetratricopeptide (TPR) repeat protein
MNYLVLHMDVEFIVGAVCVDNGNPYPITNGNEDLLWLYFFNNPHQSRISFGKENKAHFNNGEVNYYGRFFEKIEETQDKFLLRGIEQPVINLLEYSGLLETIKTAYRKKTHDSHPENIPTLITFSSSIGDNAKQKTVDYFKSHGFQIESYTIPLAELTCYHALNRKTVKAGNGSMAIFLEASNSTLHLKKLVLSNNYFLMEGETKSYRGKGIDPRKRALVRFVVNEVNKVTGILSSEDEKENECERLEMSADEWLKRLDAQNRNMPLRIASVSFSKALHMKRDVLVRKTDVDSDTGYYTQELRDIFEAYKTDTAGAADVAAVFLLGDCFQNGRVKSSFEQLIDRDRLIFYANGNIRQILSMYPEIDIKRYADEEARIQARAEVEELKQAEQRALEDKRRKAVEAEVARLARAQKAEQDRKEAKKLHDRAVALSRESKWQDAIANMENALSLDPGNAEYQRFLSDLKDQLAKLKIKVEQYKSLLTKANKYLQEGNLESALNVYELAKEIFDSAEIRNTILEVKEKIKTRKQREETIRRLFDKAELLSGKEQFEEAQNELNRILAIDETHKAANARLKEIRSLLQEREIQYKTLVKNADKNFNSGQLAVAGNSYKEALKIRPNDAYCTQQLKIIAEKVRRKAAEREKCTQLCAEADALSVQNRWTEAKAKYEEALTLNPQENGLQAKIKQCADKIREQKEAVDELIFEATLAKKKGNLQEALSLLEKVLKLMPDDTNIKSKIKALRFDMDFERNTNSTKGKNSTGDDFLGRKQHQVPESRHPQKESEDDFLNPKPEKAVKEEKEDDFLGLGKKRKDDFLNSNR